VRFPWLALFRDLITDRLFFSSFPPLGLSQRTWLRVLVGFAAGIGLRFLCFLRVLFFLSVLGLLCLLCLPCFLGLLCVRWSLCSAYPVSAVSCRIKSFCFVFFCFGLDQKFWFWFGSKVCALFFFVLVWIKSFCFVLDQKFALCFFFLFGSKVSVLFCFVCNQKCLCDLCFLCSLVSVDNGNERCLRVMRIDIAVKCISSSVCVGSCPNCHRSTLYSGKGFLDRQYQYLPLAETLPQR
jgi:hypothetical protein